MGIGDVKPMRFDIVEAIWDKRPPKPLFAIGETGPI
jgi:hypothetical protein